MRALLSVAFKDFLQELSALSAENTFCSAVLDSTSDVSRPNKVLFELFWLLRFKTQGHPNQIFIKLIRLPVKRNS